MSAYVVSLIRTWSPLVVGLVVSWLASFGVQLDGSAEAALAAGITALAGGLWYAGVRALESRWPWLGLLLGAAKAPVYPNVSSLTAWRAQRRAVRTMNRSRHAA